MRAAMSQVYIMSRRHTTQAQQANCHVRAFQVKFISFSSSNQCCQPI